MSNKGLKKVTPKLLAKIRKILNGDCNTLEDENIILFSGEKWGLATYIEFTYRKHEISVEVVDGVITVFTFDYYGGNFIGNKAREIGKFQF